jgi:hypothetical protein
VIFKEALGVALRVRELKETKISSSSLLINAHAHAKPTCERGERRERERQIWTLIFF